jgi:hypothetical protein
MRAFPPAALRSRWLVVAMAGWLVGCGAATTDPGLDLWMRVRAAQLVRQPLPSPAGGPAISSLDVRSRQFFPGEARNSFGGRAGGSAHAVNLALEGQDAYWVVPVGPFDEAVREELTWRASVDFAPFLPVGPFTLLAQAVDAAGTPGEHARAALEALSVVPAGELVVSLEWDAQVDADLVVVDPLGVVLSQKNINTWSPPPPGAPQPPPGAPRVGGVLDFDSNANCVLDGRRRENAIWTQPPPSGRHQVLVSLASACGLPRATFVVTVRKSGELVQRAGGALYEADARGSATDEDASLGVAVLEFDVP